MPLFIEKTWIQKFYSARTARSRVMLLSHTESKDQGMLNAIVHTNLSTTINSCGDTRLISRPILQGSKPNKINYVCILSSLQTAKMIIKPTWIYVLSGNIDSIGNSIPKSIKNFATVEDSWFVQLWVVYKHDYERN